MHETEPGGPLLARVTAYLLMNEGRRRIEVPIPTGTTRKHRRLTTRRCKALGWKVKIAGGKMVFTK